MNVSDRPISAAEDAIEDDLSTKSVAREHWSRPTVQLYLDGQAISSRDCLTSGDRVI